MDRPARDLLGLLDEVETVLGMQPIPMNWPIGDGDSFLGVYDRLARQVYLYDRTARNQTISPETMTTLDDARIRAGLSQAQAEELGEQLELLDALDLQFDRQLFLNGQQTPVYFGSALTNFGVQLFLDQFVAYAPAPRAYPSDAGLIQPELAGFSGFVFKIQANMNPRHRDSVAFVRICSGRFERNMLVNQPRTGKTMRLPRPYKFFADAREIVEEAYPGDIIGLPGNGRFAIGDTLCASDAFNFAPIPRFSPAHFARLINLDISKHKQFSKGLQQLEIEGAMQVLYQVEAQRRDPILAVLGALQFEVVQARLENEYGVSTRLEMLPHQVARRVAGPPEQIERLPWQYGALRTEDRSGQLVGLFRTHHEFNFYREQYPELDFFG